MDDLRESIHLTNNSVQKRYKNKVNRDSRLPKNNMWSLDQFKCHLRHVGAPEGTWSKVYNGIKQNLVAVVLASLDETELVPNAFELYGCDFMLDEHYNPILIEINSTPDLSASTEITARICPLALKDCIRVVLDVPRNPLAATGLFERAFQVNYNVNKEVDGTRPLELNGTQMKLFDSMPKLRNTPRTRLLRKILNNVRTTTSRKFGKDKAKSSSTLPTKVIVGKLAMKVRLHSPILIHYIYHFHFPLETVQRKLEGYSRGQQNNIEFKGARESSITIYGTQMTTSGKQLFMHIYFYLVLTTNICPNPSIASGNLYIAASFATI